MCDSIIITLVDIFEKSKDGLKIRLDLVDTSEKNEKKLMYLPLTCYTLFIKEKDVLRHCLTSVKVSDGYSSNIKKLYL